MSRVATGAAAAAITLMMAGAGYAQNAPALRMYAQPGFAGDSRRVDRGVENLAAMQFGDAARSMIAEGRWEVCLDPGYAGGCRVVQGRVSDMGDWNARVSSARYLGPSDWGSTGDSAAPGGASGPATTVASTASSASGPQYRLDYRPEAIGNIYDTDFGRLTLERWDLGGATGSYDGTAADRSDAGRFEGSVTPDPSDDGTNLSGNWYAATSGQRCASERGGTHYWGSMTLIFNRSHDRFQGYWAYCDSDGAPEGSWHGTLVGRDPTIAAAVSAQLAGAGQGSIARTAQPGPQTAGPSQGAPVDAQGRPLPGFIDRTARAAGDEAERRVQDRIREGIGRIF